MKLLAGNFVREFTTRRVDYNRRFANLYRLSNVADLERELEVHDLGDFHCGFCTRRAKPVLLDGDFVRRRSNIGEHKQPGVVRYGFLLYPRSDVCQANLGVGNRSSLWVDD